MKTISGFNAAPITVFSQLLRHQLNTNYVFVMKGSTSCIAAMKMKFLSLHKQIKTRVFETVWIWLHPVKLFLYSDIELLRSHQNSFQHEILSLNKSGPYSWIGIFSIDSSKCCDLWFFAWLIWDSSRSIPIVAIKTILMGVGYLKITKVIWNTYNVI